MSKPIITTDTPVMGIFCKDEFQQLTAREQQYCYNFSQAAWTGAKICYFQKSYESPAIFIILQLVFSSQNQSVEQLKEAALKVIKKEEYEAIVVYAASFFNNCGNFKSFGDSKFIPDVSEETFFKFIQVSENYAPFRNLIDSLWNDVKVPMFGYQGKLEKIGYPPEAGQTGYYSQNISKDEIAFVDNFLQALNIDPLNTRIIKQSDEHYQVYVASVAPNKKTHYFQGKRIDLVYGDYSSILRKVSQNLEEAVDFAANPLQKQMLQKYVEHFTFGSIDVHKDSQRLWVRDTNPVVETNIGFIESYLDPKQVRAEFEGFVSLVNKKQSEITKKLVDQAPELLKLMPWPAEFEKDKFLKPDFTVLSILAFGCSGTPLGINIPNYDDIRQEEGFKNVYLLNCLPKMKAGNILFLSEEDQQVQIDNFEAMMFHKVIFHELLGHGCGKLFQKTSTGLNFDQSIKNPLTGEPIKSYYNETDTWMSIFQNYSNPYEECRADSVALYFSCFKEATMALQPELESKWKDLCVAQYLNFIYAGLTGLQFYNVEAQKWGQAHINGRWVILQVLLEAGNGFLTIEKTKDSEGKDTVSVKLDREQCFTTGKKAMEQFLLKLQVYKSTADFENGKKMYDGYSAVSEKWLEIRQIVLDNKKPRRLEVQGHLQKNEDGSFEYFEFPETHEGIIESYIKRYPYFDSEMYDLFQQHKKLNKPSL